MSKHNALHRSREKLTQRIPHSFFVLAILARQKGKTVGLKVDQGVSDNQRSAVRWLIKHNLACNRAFNLNDLQFATDHRVAGRFAKPRWSRIWKCLGVREKWD